MNTEVQIWLLPEGMILLAKHTSIFSGIGMGLTLLKGGSYLIYLTEHMNFVHFTYKLHFNK